MLKQSPGWGRCHIWFLYDTHLNLNLRKCCRLRTLVSQLSNRVLQNFTNTVFVTLSIYCVIHKYKATNISCDMMDIAASLIRRYDKLIWTQETTSLKQNWTEVLLTSVLISILFAYHESLSDKLHRMSNPYVNMNTFTQLGCLYSIADKHPQCTWTYTNPWPICHEQEYLRPGGVGMGGGGVSI